MKLRIALILVAALLLPSAAINAADEKPAPVPAAVQGAAILPKDIVWETNETDPIIGAPNAIRGGRINLDMRSYPVTFRLVGPNSNDFFASWNRQFTMLFTLVQLHPVTDKFIPMMATHWSIQPDQKTIYLKLDPDAKFSDGHPITADDYVFTLEMMRSKYILDPFYNTYAEQYYQSVDKIDDYTLRIVGTRPSWRPLYDYAMLWPTPAHATKLDDTWVNRTTNQPQIAVGPYIISDTERGVSVTFKRIPNWWGDKKRYFTGLYNFDEIHLRVIQPDRTLDYLRQGELDMMLEPSAKTWNEGYTFPAVQNGWLRRARVFTDWPSGIRGIQMNLEAPIFQNKDFRTAIQYLFNFDRVNKNLMYGEYFRKNSFFDGTIYANPAATARPFDPAKAREYLAKAGYHRPSEQDRGIWGKLKNVASGLLVPRSDTEDILVNDKGEKASFTLLYYDKNSERLLTVVQQDFRRAGVDLRLQQLEGGAAFQRGLERKFEALLLAMTSGMFPDPRQYLGTEFKNTKNNNDFWAFGTEEVDALIKTYEENMDAEKRLEALHRIDEIVRDEAFYLPFYDAPYLRIVHWDYVQFPEFYLPRRTEQITDWMVYWIDPQKKAALQEAMRTNKAYPVDPVLDKDFYGVRSKR